MRQALSCYTATDLYFIDGDSVLPICGGDVVERVLAQFAVEDQGCGAVGLLVPGALLG